MFLLFTLLALIHTGCLPPVIASSSGSLSSTSSVIPQLVPPCHCRCSGETSCFLVEQSSWISSRQPPWLQVVPMIHPYKWWRWEKKYWMRDSGAVAPSVGSVKACCLISTEIWKVTYNAKVWCMVKSSCLFSLVIRKCNIYFKPTSAARVQLFSVSHHSLHTDRRQTVQHSWVLITHQALARRVIDPYVMSCLTQPRNE